MVEVIVPNPNSKKIDLVNSNFHESLGWQRSSGYLQEWTDWNDLYRGIPDDKPHAWMSNKFIPHVMAKVETAYANLQSLLFAANPPFQVRPRESGDAVAASLMQKLLQYQFDEANVNYEFMQFIRSLCIFGTSIGKVVWDRKFDNRTIISPTTEPIVNIFGMQLGQRVTGFEAKNEQYISFDGPTLINCNLADIFPEPTSIEIQDGYIVERSYKTIDYLRNMHKNYPDTYNEEVLKLTSSDSSNRKDAADDTQANNSRLNNTSVTRPEGSERIELLTRWGLDIDTDGVLKSRVLTIANGKWLIRNTNNPFWHGKNPFIKATYIPVINEFYGIGIPELMEDLQTTLNEMVNQRNDNISFALNRIVLYDKDDVDVKKVKNEPGLRIGVSGNGNSVDSKVKFLDIPLNTRDTFVHTQEIERWMQEVSAVTKLTMGITGTDVNQTATGMGILTKASGDRFMAIAKVVEQTAFKELIRQFYQLDYQYITQQKMVRIVGEQGNTWIPITPGDVRRDYDFVPAGIFTLENKQQQALKLIQFKQITQGDPTIKQNVINQKIYSALQIGDDPKEIMYDDAQMQDIMRVAQMMAMKMVAQHIQEQKPVEDKVKKGTGNGQFKQGSVTGSAQVPPPTPPSTQLGA